MKTAAQKQQELSEETISEKQYDHEPKVLKKSELKHEPVYNTRAAERKKSPPASPPHKESPKKLLESP
jgi:hypothetical protein